MCVILLRTLEKQMETNNRCPKVRRPNAQIFCLFSLKRRIESSQLATNLRKKIKYVPLGVSCLKCDQKIHFRTPYISLSLFRGILLPYNGILSFDYQLKDYT